MQPMAAELQNKNAVETFFERFVVRPIQFARWPSLTLPRPPHGPFGFVVGMVTVDLFLRLSTVWLVLAGTSILGGAEYTAIDETEPAGWILLLFVVVVAPLTEEAAMRLIVHPWSPWRFAIGLICWLGFGAMAFLSGGWAWIIPAWPVVLLIWRLTRRAETAERQWSSHQGFVVWFTIIGFALAHVSNYSIPNVDWRVASVVLLVVPQLIGGVLITYTRVKAGFWAAVAHHALSNAPFGLLLVAASQAS